MVPRYSRPEMTAIWSAENRYRIWWQIEVFAAEAMGKIGMIPAEDAETIRAAYDATRWATSTSPRSTPSRRSPSMT